MAGAATAVELGGEGIAVLNPKGGTGKTTLATNLARALHDRGLRTLLVDSDPQGSAADWHAGREDNPLPLLAYGKPENFKALPGIAQPYAYVLIDGAAKLEGMITAALKVADRVLIPVQPSPYDIWAVTDLVDLIRARQEVTEGKPERPSSSRGRCGGRSYTGRSTPPFPNIPSRSSRLARCSGRATRARRPRAERVRGRQPGGGPRDQRYRRRAAEDGRWRLAPGAPSAKE